MKTWVLIPAYNEAQRLGKLLAQIKSKGFPVLVVDDGSIDSTYDEAKKNAFVVIKNAVNMGKGRALSFGIKYLLKNTDFDCVVLMDADGQHSPDDIDKFLAQADKGSALVVGNRMSKTGTMPLVRVLTNKFMSWLISSIIKQKIPDTQCGFRLIKREVLENINIETDKFEVESEIIIKAGKNKFPISSVPIESIYFTDHCSKVDPLRDTFRFFKFILLRQTPHV